MSYRTTEGGVTAAKGFQSASTAAGIKYKDRPDMALIYSQVPCTAAGTFTTNIVKAAPVRWDQDIVYNKPAAQAVVINAGIANACTGTEGYGYCKDTADAAGDILGIPADSVLVASTGVIGMQLPLDRLKEGIRKLTETKAEGPEAGRDRRGSVVASGIAKLRSAPMFMRVLPACRRTDPPTKDP